jgi:cell division protein FtsB
MGGNYEKNLFRHLQETIEKVDHLTKELASLKIKHNREIEILKSENQRLNKANLVLKEENKRLKEIISKNSSNPEIFTVRT